MNIEQAWNHAVTDIWTNGTLVTTEDKDTIKEKLNLVISFKPVLGRIPDNYQIKRPGLECYKTQLMTPINTWGFEYTYGERLWTWGKEIGFEINQIEDAINRLCSNPTTRRATCDLAIPSRDTTTEEPPCLRLVDFKLRKNNKGIIPIEELHMTVVFRSHDIFGAALANWVALSELMNYVASEISKRMGRNIVLGTLTNHSISAHIYERDFDNINK